MKSNRQARHILGLNYKLSNQRKVVIEGDHETQVTTPPAENATRASKFQTETENTIGKTDGVFVYVLR